MKIKKLKLKIFSINGQMLVEVLLAIGLAAILLPALLTGLIASRAAKPEQDQRMQAVALMKETEAAVKSIRNNDWNTFSALSGKGALHPIISSSAWATASGSQSVNNLTQQFVVSDVNRDSNGNITAIGTPDPSTKQVVITISWTQPYSSSLSTTLYLTRTGNLTNIETTTTDFNRGTTTNSSVIATTGSSIPLDGEVELGAGGSGGDWCKPGQFVLQTFDLPGQGVATSITATSSATNNYAYTTTGGNASGDALDALTIDHSSPPNVTNPSFNNEAKAYGVFVDSLNSYVYFNENDPPNHTVRILHGTTLASAGYFDASSNGTGSSIYVLGNNGFTTVGSKLYSFSVATINGSSSQAQLGSINLAGTGNRVFVVGTNAYVATSSTTSQLQIINVSNPSNMSVTKSINLGNSQAATDVYVNSSQTYAYIVTSYSAGKNDFFIVDLNNTNNIYGYQTVNNMSPKGIAIVSGNRAIVVGSGGEEYTVYDVTTPSAVTRCGGMTPAGVTTINAVAPILQPDGNAYAYIVTDNSSAEFQIILGGSGGQFSTSGIYESGTFDPYTIDGISTLRSFNRLNATVAQPAATTLQVQVAVAAPINNSCNGVTYTYVGPNGDKSSYFTPSDGILDAAIPTSTYSPTYQNPGRCFRYKAWLYSTDPSQTPIIYDATLNYSP